MKGLTGAILIAAMVFAGPAFAQFYKYLDKQGVVRFTDDINQVPTGPAGRSPKLLRVAGQRHVRRGKVLGRQGGKTGRPLRRRRLRPRPLARVKIRSRAPARGWRP